MLFSVSPLTPRGKIVFLKKNLLLLGWQSDMSKYMFGFEDKGITMATEAGQPECAWNKHHPPTATLTHTQSLNINRTCSHGSRQIDSLTYDLNTHMNHQIIVKHLWTFLSQTLR